MGMAGLFVKPEREIVILDEAEILTRTVDNYWLCS